MNLLLVTLSKPFRIGDEDLEAIGDEVKRIAERFGMKIDVDFEKLGDD